MPQKGNFEGKKFDYSIVFIFSSPPKKSLKFTLTTFLAMGPCLLLLEHLFCLSHRKTRWIMSTDNVGLETCLGKPRIP
jgi:hypothetical protein